MGADELGQGGQFARMVKALGGPSDFMDNPQKHLREARVVKPVFADDEGAVSSIATRENGCRSL